MSRKLDGLAERMDEARAITLEEVYCFEVSST